MTPPLTDEELANARTLVPAECVGLLRILDAAVEEIRAHRSRLSGEDVEALRWLVFMLGKHGHEPYAYESEECDRALAVLSRLCAAKEGV